MNEMGPGVRIHSLGLHLDKTERATAEAGKEDVAKHRLNQHGF